MGFTRGGESMRLLHYYSAVHWTMSKCLIYIYMTAINSLPRLWAGPDAGGQQDSSRCVPHRGGEGLMVIDPLYLRVPLSHPSRTELVYAVVVVVFYHKRPFAFH